VIGVMAAQDSPKVLVPVRVWSRPQSIEVTTKKGRIMRDVSSALDASDKRITITLLGVMVSAHGFYPLRSGFESLGRDQFSISTPSK